MLVNVAKGFVAQDKLIQTIRDNAYRLVTSDDLDPLMDRIGDARVVMLGEASHGTHEYYTWRSKITKRLINEKGFNFIAVEGDWPDCYKVDRYIKGLSPEPHAQNVLYDNKRWPTWMWANWEVVALAEWLFKHNNGLHRDHKVGFYGLDVYSLWESLDAVMEYLTDMDPEALEVARQALRCFEPYREGDGESYARALRLVPELCETEVVNMLAEIRRRMPLYADDESALSTEQNAHIVVNAERYYRSMMEGGPNSWNVRDVHMQETLDRLLKHHGPESKAIVWEHNTHIGDARATDMHDVGMYNIGELARKQYGEQDVVLVGFGSYEGTVVAGSFWGDNMKVMMVPKAPEGTWEYLMHEAGAENKLLIMNDIKNDELMNRPRGHRAIGVVYRPEYEQSGNYVPSVMPARYDAFVHIDYTKALHPIHMKPNGHLMPETYPFGE